MGSDEMLQVKHLAPCLVQREGRNDLLFSSDLPLSQHGHRAHEGLTSGQGVSVTPKLRVKNEQKGHPQALSAC